MLKKAMLTLLIILGVYALICMLMYTFQEKFIFLPDKLDKDHRFSFSGPFEEINITTEDEKMLHGVLFKSDSAKGLIFYLHGNAGSIDSWGHVAELYTSLQYDIFLLDYRGYGKSDGTIKNEEQLFQDIHAAYNEVLKRYDEANVIVVGYSIGTGPAANLASTNNPKLLILQAPYYSLTDVMKHTYRIIPTFLLKYKLELYRYIPDCRMPIVLFHGDEDGVIPYNQSLKLKKLLKPSDTLITIKGLGHNGMTFNSDYIREIERVLKKQ
jgi:pimeloyl-ACP methyl ester carboxylesterase